MNLGRPRAANTDIGGAAALAAVIGAAANGATATGTAADGAAANDAVAAGLRPAVLPWPVVRRLVLPTPVLRQPVRPWPVWPQLMLPRQSAMPTSTRPSARPTLRPSGRADATALVAPLGMHELDELQALLDRVPPPLEPLDVCMLDGFLCGVLVQPRPVLVSRWMPHVTDADGRPLPRHFDAGRLQALALRRHTELDAAIARRGWFDPWVFELGDDPGEASNETASQPFSIEQDGEWQGHTGAGDRADGDGDGGDADEHDEHDDAAPSAIDAVYPWVAGFATALELFPELMRADAKALNEPLALLYRHLAADDLEDADDLLEEIESMQPPADLSEAVEGLVRATLLLADIGRPVSQPTATAPVRRTRPPHPMRRR